MKEKNPLVQSELAPHEAPSYIESRGMLPKSKVGKLLHQEIRDKEKRK